MRAQFESTGVRRGTSTHQTSRWVLVLLTAMVWLFGATMAPAQNVLEEWHFEGDLSSTGSATTTAAGSTSYVAGKVGQAFRINAQHGYAAIDGLAHRLADGPFAISMWVLYHGDFVGHVRHEHAFTSGWIGFEAAIDLFGERAGGRTLYTVNGGGQFLDIPSGPSWIEQQDQWHHMVLGRDGNQFYLCSNGQMMATGSAAPLDYRSRPDRSYIGYNPPHNGGRSFPGAFDEMIVYDGWIGDEGCAWLYQNPGESFLPGTPGGSGGFDEGSGTTVDFGSGTTGELVGGATWGAGQQGGGLEFDGSGYVEVVDSGADSPFDLGGDLTLALWVRPDALGGTQVLLSKDDAYELEIGKLGDTTWDLRISNEVVGTGATPITEGVWQHLGVTWDGTTVRFYRNGVADGSAPFSGTVTVNDSNVGVGARPSPPQGGGPTFHFEGAIDELKIFGRALSDTEIADLFGSTVSDIAPPVRSNAVPGTPIAGAGGSVIFGLSTDETATCRYTQTSQDVRYADMVSTFDTLDGQVHDDSALAAPGVSRYYARCRDALGNTNGDDFLVPIVVGAVDLDDGLFLSLAFEEGTGCSTFDNANIHSVPLGPDCGTGNAPLWTTGVVDSALVFDGDDDRVTGLQPGELATPTALTIGGWVRHLPTVQYRAIVDVRNALTDGYSFYLSDASKLFLRVGGSTLVSPGVVADNTWHHVAGTWDGSAITLYVDGLPVATGPASETVNVFTDMLVGHHFSQPGYTFEGRLDEVEVYNRALSAEEVFQLFFQKKP